MSLMISISGIRGIIGESLTPEIVVKYAAAFGEYCIRHHPDNPEVVLGRDGRVSGKIIGNLVSSTLLSAGVNVRALGVCPTPTIQLAVEKSKAAGGISITASHNPVQWNGLKFLASSGMFLDGKENQELRAIADSGKPRLVAWNALGRHAADDSWIRKHVDTVLALKLINPETIRRRKLKVAVDCINASGGVIVPMLLRELGCTVIEMNCDVSGVFAHTPEPIPENLTDLAARVKKEGADLGIAVDPDGDRLVLITEQGKPFGEEYTIASAVRFVLEKEAGDRRRETGKTEEGERRKEKGDGPKVVINLSTTRAVEDIAKAYGAEVIRTPVGEINVAASMKEVGAVVGGEGSGGVILAAAHYGRDAIVGIPLILQLLVESGGTLSALKASTPQYFISKSKINLDSSSPDRVLNEVLRSQKNSGNVNTEDGLRFDFPEYWVHLRKSNTEPIIRVIAEARTSAEADRIVEEWKKKIVESV